MSGNSPTAPRRRAPTAQWPSFRISSSFFGNVVWYRNQLERAKPRGRIDRGIRRDLGPTVFARTYDPTGEDAVDDKPSMVSMVRICALCQSSPSFLRLLPPVAMNNTAATDPAWTFRSSEHARTARSRDHTTATPESELPRWPKIVEPFSSSGLRRFPSLSRPGLEVISSAGRWRRKNADKLVETALDRLPLAFRPKTKLVIVTSCSKSVE